MILVKKIAGVMLIILVFMSFVISGCGSSESNNLGYKNIGPEQLQSMMDSDKDLLVVDVREQEEYQQGHIANSILMPTSAFQDRVNELPKDKSIALVCASGARSAQVADFLVQSGYKDVYNLERGLMVWPYQLVK